jgi:hypothetical protein
MAKAKAKARKATKSAKKPSIQLEGISKLTMTMPIDETKARAIQRCIEKGTLKITVSKVDLGSGILGGEAWLYD